MTTLHLHLADAPTDVLVYLVGVPWNEQRTIYAITEAVAPADVPDPGALVGSALRLLTELGYVTRNRVDDWIMFRATNAGRAAVAEALAASDSPALVSPEQTPTPAADSAHRGDQCTVGEVPNG